MDDPLPSANEIFVADGLTFGIRIHDGSVAVAAGETEEARTLVAERLGLSTLKPFEPPSAHYRDAEATNLTLMIAQRCNLRCTYCYGGDGEYGTPGMLDLPAASKAVEAFLSRDGATDRTINFFGGEPLLALRTMRKLVGLALRLAVKFDRKVSFSMTTNATLVDKEIASWLAMLPFSVMVSIDGDPDMHGRNRPDASGQSSWNAVLEGAQLLLKYLGPRRVRARATLTSGYPEIERIVATLEEIGFSTIAMSPVEAVKDGSGGWSADDHAQLTGAISRLAARNLNDEADAPSWNPLQDPMSLLASGKRRGRPCGVGNTARAVSSDGQLYPCHRYVGDKRFVIGRAETAEVEPTSPGFVRFEEQRRRAVAECGACFAQTFCAGSCAHVALVRMDGGLSAHDSHECGSIRWQTREAIRAFAGLRIGPAPGRAELLDPSYLLRPASTSAFRSVVESFTRSRPVQSRWELQYDAWIKAEHSAAMATLDARIEGESRLNELDHYDWLTVALVRFLVEQGILDPPSREEARSLGLAIAIVGYVHGLSNIRKASEMIQIAWAAGYSRALVTLLAMPSGMRLAEHLIELSAVFLEAREAEAGWQESRVPDDWQKVTAAKHRPLVFPSMVLAAVQGRDEVVKDVEAFAKQVGPMRQRLDDYIDMADDLRSRKLNWWTIELQTLLGEVAPEAWPRTLAHSNISGLVRNTIIRDATAGASETDALQWIKPGLEAYATWLCTKVDKISWRRQRLATTET